jgi:hypothetical protein
MASSTGTWWSVSSSTFLADVSVTTGSDAIVKLTDTENYWSLTSNRFHATGKKQLQF